MLGLHGPAPADVHGGRRAAAALRELHAAADAAFDASLALLAPGPPRPTRRGGGPDRGGRLHHARRPRPRLRGRLLAARARRHHPQLEPLLDFVFEEGMTLVVQPNVVTPRRARRGSDRGAVVVTDGRRERLHPSSADCSALAGQAFVAGRRWTASTIPCSRCSGRGCRPAPRGSPLARARRVAQERLERHQEARRCRSRTAGRASRGRPAQRVVGSPSPSTCAASGRPPARPASGTSAPARRRAGPCRRRTRPARSRPSCRSARPGGG